MNKKTIKYFIFFFLSVFFFINLIAFFHAYKFTHFSDTSKTKTKAKNLSLIEKASIIFFGISNPRPENDCVPSLKYEKIKIKSNKEIECWEIKNDTSKGTVAIFHGYGGNKSSMLDKAMIFYEKGYSVLLVDFMGSGGSEGNQTTVGYKESIEVKDVFNHIKKSGEKNIILFGTSMGAVSIMKAQNDFDLNSSALILECPFGSMTQTVKARFNSLGIPSFPMAYLLVFWGGIENGFNAFEHNPINYAKKINTPTLILYGEKDEKVSRAEIDAIYKNFNSYKELKIYPNAGHENYLLKYENEWINDVSRFLEAKY